MQCTDLQFQKLGLTLTVKGLRSHHMSKRVNLQLLETALWQCGRHGRFDSTCSDTHVMCSAGDV